MSEIMPSQFVRQYVLGKVEGSIDELVVNLMGEFPTSYSRADAERIVFSTLNGMKNEGKVRLNYQDQYQGQPLWESTE